MLHEGAAAQSLPADARRRPGPRARRGPHRRRRRLRGAPPPGRRRLLQLPGRRHPAALRRPRRLPRAPPRPRPPRAGRRPRGRRLRPRDRQGRRLHGHLRPRRHEPRHRASARPSSTRIPMVAITGNVPVGADRQGRLPGDRHQRHHPADDEAQLPRPERRRPAARPRRGLPHRPDRPARARSTSTSPRTPSSRRPRARTRPRPRSSPACPASARTWTATTASSRLAAAEIAAAKRPMILAGHGILHAHAEAELLAFAEKTSIPIAWTLLGIGAVDERHPLAYGYMGMHGWKHVNRAIQSADLLFAIGMRFDDRVTGNVRTYAPYARIVHVDIDPAEIGKNVAVEVPIVGDAKRVLQGARPDGRGDPARGRAATTSTSWPSGSRTREASQLARLRRLARRPPLGRLRRPADRRADRPRGDLRRRRRPEPDVAGPLRRLPPPEHAPQLGRPRHDGLPHAGGDGRRPRRPRARGLGDRRRRRLPDDAPGADDPRPGPDPGEDRPLRQQEAGDDPAVAGDHLRRQLPLGAPARARTT